MADMNFQNTGFQIPSDKRQIKIDASVFQRAIRHITAPVFDFFTKTADEEDVVTDFDGAIAAKEMQVAVTQRILNESEPPTGQKFNIVF